MLVMTFSNSIYNPQVELSPKEMLEISQEINRDFAPDFSIKKPEPAAQPKLSAEEMLEISEEIRQGFAPRASDNTEELVLLPVDPDHLYAYWKLGDDKANTAPKNNPGNQLTLRIYPEPNKNPDITETKSWFDVAIDSYQAQQSVALPMWNHETAYRASIGNREPDNSLAELAKSNVINVIHVPFGKVIPNQVKGNQIVFKATPQFTTVSREISTYSNNSASGQVNN